VFNVGLTIASAPNSAGKSRGLYGERLRDRPITHLLCGYREKCGNYQLLEQSEGRPCISRRVSVLLESSLVCTGLSLSEGRRIIQDTLDGFGMGGLANRDITTLSGGEDQVIHLLDSLLLPAGTVLLDSPFSMLDGVRQNIARRVIHDFLSGQGLAYRRKNVLIASVEEPNAIYPLATRDCVPTTTFVDEHGLLDTNDCHAMALALRRCRIERSDERVIRCEELRLDAQQPIFRNGVTVELRTGRAYVITGPNGAGKSLLCRALSDCLPRGIRISSGSIARTPDSGATIYVPQKCRRIFLKHTSRELYVTVLRRLGFSSAEVVRLFGFIGALRDCPIVETSSGAVRFLVHLLAVLIALSRSDVSWHIADEPDDSLDSSRRALLAEVFEFLAESGKGVIIVTHDRECYPYAMEVPLK